MAPISLRQSLIVTSSLSQFPKVVHMLNFKNSETIYINIPWNIFLITLCILLKKIVDFRNINNRKTLVFPIVKDSFTDTLNDLTGFFFDSLV